ncbi:tetratricopeptide repeat protein [Streptosporangiaceae bacterium NEAU-GS5]|nr:tetratricopeptide repeat protein [Streptosporangiaceae bacterium NEAU-GS5]
MRYRLLGPLMVGEPDTPVDLGGPRQAKVAAALLLRAGEMVPVAALVAALWDEEPPRSAVKVTRNCVSALRGALTRAGDPARLHATGTGYRMLIPAGEIDTVAFHAHRSAARELTAQGLNDQAAAELRAALALWRGPALDGLDSRALAPATSNLDEQRLVAWEQYAEVELCLGRHQDLVGPLTELAAAEPLREGLVGHLMLALYRSGRQAEALKTYRTLRRRLRDELGVDPDQKLTERHERMLRADPALQAVAMTQAGPPGQAGQAARAVVPRQLPAVARHFTGRIGHLDHLDTALSAGGASVAVVGPAGTGKTTLATFWAHKVADRFPDGQLYADLRGYAQGRPIAPLEALARFLRALGVAPEGVPVEVDEAAALYRSMLAGRRALVLLDNAADPEHVRPLMPAGPGCFTLITSRHQMDGLVVVDGSERLPLGAFTPPESLALMGRLIGEDRVMTESEATAELADLCGHLPLAVRLAAAGPARHPGLRIEDQVAALRDADRLDALSVPGDPKATVAAAFDLSYQRLSAPARRLFRLLGLVPGSDADVEAAAALAGLPASSAAPVLAELTDAHMAQESAPGRFSLHDLIKLYASRLALAHDGEPAGEAALARLITWYLRTADAAARVLYPHMLRLPMPETEGDAAARTFAGAHQAGAWLDAELANLVAVLRQAADQGLGRPVWLLADTLRGYFWLRQCRVEWLAVAEAARGAAESAADDRAAAAAYLSLADAHHNLASRDQAIGHATTARRLAEKSGWALCEVAALNTLGMVHSAHGLLEPAAEYFARALNAGAAAGHLGGQAALLNNLGTLHERLGRLNEAIENRRRALALHRELGSRSGVAFALNNLSGALWLAGEWAAALATAEEVLAVCAEVGDLAGEASAEVRLAGIHLDCGRHEQALEHARRSVEVAGRTANQVLEVNAELILGAVERRTGRAAEAIDRFRHVLRLCRSDNHLRAAQAGIALAAALRDLGRYGAADGAADRALALSRDGRFRLLEAEALTELAATALARDDVGKAVERGREAVAALDGTGYRLGLARALAGLGESSRRAGDTEAAVAHRQAALALFEALGSPEADLLRAADEVGRDALTA